MNQRPTKKKITKSLKTVLKIAVIAAMIYFFPAFSSFYLCCGILDFQRNHLYDWASINRYFFGNGLLTWALSPFNLFIDIFTAKNKGVYQLSDLPKDYQNEINYLVHTFNNEKILDVLKEKMQSKKRGMVFFKWYGKNIDSFLKIDEFHKDFKYIKTIGVSVFNKHQSTSAHFGPLRVTLRVLHNFSPSHNNNIYIQVGKHKHYWHDDAFFIFDDTLMHKSVNDSDQLRYCMFVDVIRPSHHPKMLSHLVKMLQVILLQINKIFYKNWDFL